MLWFVDNLVLLATTEKGLQTALFEMDNIFLTFRLNINTKDEQNINIFFKGNRIEQVDQIKCLGNIMSSDRRLENEMKIRIGQAKKWFLLKRKSLT